MTTTTPATIVAVVVTRKFRDRLTRRVRECGDTFRYEGHQETKDGLSLYVSCICPDGHGVAHLPWKGWLDSDSGRYDLRDIPTPQRTQWISTEPPSDEIPEDLIEDLLEDLYAKLDADLRAAVNSAMSVALDSQVIEEHVFEPYGIAVA